MPTSAELIAAHTQWMRSRYSENTVDDSSRLLRRADRELPYGLPCSTFEELENWLGHDPAWTPQTRETYRKHICRFFVWATRPQAPKITLNPAVGLEPFKVEAGVPRPAATAHVEWCVTEATLPWRVFCVLTAYSGARPCEVARIAEAPHEFVTEDTTTIIKGKGGKSRVIPTHEVLWDAVRYLPQGPLHVRRGGLPLNGDWVSKRTAAYLHRNGLPITLYNLRHWYGTELQEAAGDSRVTQEGMGHSSLNSTQIYTQVRNPRLRAAVNSLPAFRRR
jgi:integrase/recombinase XerC